MVKCDIPFANIVLSQAIPILKDLVAMSGPVEENLEIF